MYVCENRFGTLVGINIPRTKPSGFLILNQFVNYYVRKDTTYNEEISNYISTPRSGEKLRGKTEEEILFDGFYSVSSDNIDETDVIKIKQNGKM